MYQQVTKIFATHMGSFATLMGSFATDFTTLMGRFATDMGSFATPLGSGCFNPLIYKHLNEVAFFDKLYINIFNTFGFSKGFFV